MSQSLYADSAYVEQLIKSAEQNTLAQSRGWHALLHYKPGGVFHKWESQADDQAFFISSDGKYQAESELAATIRAIAEPVTIIDQHPQCRFPARYHWLKQQLDIDPEKLVGVVCSELNAWFDTIKPGSLTLVFPSAYINSPSSMFGHTLLRVNPSDHRKDSPLVAYALNYAANADATDSALIFSIKGLIGGYPGIFSIVPYYEKINEYRDLENRDIWEYNLDFSQSEVDQLMRHAWEVRHIQFDYFFLTENCSYHMLSLMEVARPSLELTGEFDIKAIPADTVRAVFNAGLVSDYAYRPSSTTIISQHAAQMSAPENALAIAIAKEEIPVSADSVANKDPASRAKIYEQSYDFARFLSTANPAERDAHASTNWQLLAARSNISLVDAWQPIVEPKVRSENGHDTARIAFAAGRLEDDSFISLRLRPAYHDVLDPPAGYSKGGQINFMDLRLDYFVADDELRLNRLTFINVLSLTPGDAYFSPISWGMNLAIDRVLTANGMTNAASITADGGISASLSGDWTLSLLAEADIKAASRYEKGYSAGAGAVINLLRQSDGFSVMARYSVLAYRAGEETDKDQFELQYSYHLNNAASLRFDFTRQHYYEIYSSRAELGYHYYF